MISKEKGIFGQIDSRNSGKTRTVDCLSYGRLPSSTWNERKGACHKHPPYMTPENTAWPPDGNDPSQNHNTPVFHK